MIADYDFAMEIIILGQASVGKTNLINRYIKQEYHEESIPTVGNDYFNTHKKVQNLNLMVKFWDTAGQERFATLSSLILKNANGVILVYDMTKRDSFNKVSQWMDYVKQKNQNKVKFMLIGNKSDLHDKREIAIEEAKDFAIKNDMLFFETSAKTNKNNCVNEAFDALIEEQAKLMKSENKMRTSLINGQLMKTSHVFELKEREKENSKKDKSKCC